MLVKLVGKLCCVQGTHGSLPEFPPKSAEWLELDLGRRCSGPEICRKLARLHLFQSSRGISQERIKLKSGLDRDVVSYSASHDKRMKRAARRVAAFQTLLSYKVDEGVQCSDSRTQLLCRFPRYFSSLLAREDLTGNATLQAT